MVETVILRNSARLIVEEIPHFRSIAMGIFIKVGSRYEPDVLAGASHFVEHMLFKGTEQHTAREIAEKFENLGGQINAFTAKEYTCVYTRTLDEDMPMAMDIIFDMIFASKMSEADFATEKEVIFEEIRMYEDTPDELIHDVFNNHFFAGSSMGHPILGDFDTITALDRDTLYNYYKQYYIPENIVIAVAGNVKTENIISQVEKRMPPHAGGITRLPEFSLSAYQPFISTVVKDVEQVQICVGGPGISYHDENRHAVSLMNSILGGGMSSRLFQSLREERGLAYSVYSYSSSHSDTGSLAFYIGTGTGKIEQFFSAFAAELDKFMQAGIEEIELQRAKQMTKSSLYMGLESTNSRMSRMGRLLMMYDEYYSPEQMIEKIMAVDKPQIDALAEKMLSFKQMSMATIGNAAIIPLVEQEFNRWFR